MIGWIVGGVLLALLFWVVWTFNRLVSLDKRAEAAWSDIDVQLKRRWDLVPPLVEIVRGYSQHESKTLEDVVLARSKATTSSDMSQRSEREHQLSNAVSQLFALAESYPDLKANENFQHLHTSLVEIEDTVQNARRYYNAVVRDLNTLAQIFPANFVARVTGFGGRTFFQIEAGQRQSPQINLQVDAVPADKDLPSDPTP